MMGAAFLTVALASFQLIPFGSLEEIFRTRNPWHGFDPSRSPVMLMVRAERLEDSSPELCAAWVEAVANESPGGAAWPGGWEPWSAESREPIEGCEKFPCKVKLDSADAGQLAAAPKAARAERFVGLVRERVAAYLKGEARRAYEYPGVPAEPWELFKQAGFVSPLSMPTTPVLYGRVIDFAPGRLRAVRQVYDRRGAREPKGAGPHATVWIRDVYDAHYFESWGEWIDVGCAKSGVTLVHALAIELDNLKATDWASKLSATRMKMAAKAQGREYLEAAHQRRAARAKDYLSTSAKSRPEIPKR